MNNVTVMQEWKLSHPGWEVSYTHTSTPERQKETELSSNPLQLAWFVPALWPFLLMGKPK